jgi:2-polyprenyl-3-methyl-5-hydroxy-6-metoxy-1,4-benzoquinol methylase
MLARDWYYNERRQLGLDSAVASIYDRLDDSDSRARAALTMLGVQRGWRVADIGCGNGVLACEAAQMGAEVDAIDISPAMLALAEIHARDRKVAIRTQSAGLLSFATSPIAMISSSASSRCITCRISGRPWRCRGSMAR